MYCCLYKMSHFSDSLSTTDLDRKVVTNLSLSDCHIRKKEECDGKDLYSEDVLYPLDDHDVISLTVQGKDPKTRRVIRMRMVSL